MQRPHLPRRLGLFALRHFNRPATVGEVVSEVSQPKVLTPECLSLDQIVMATIDPDRLPQGARDHLLSCEECQSKVYVNE